MRVAMVTGSYTPRVGGMEIHVERLSQGLQRRGHEVKVVTPPMQGRSRLSGSSLPRVVERATPLGAAAEARRADVVHLHGGRSLYAAATALRLGPNVSTIFTPHCYYPPRSRLGALKRRAFDSLVGRPSLRRATRVIGLTAHGVNDAVEQGAPRSRCCVVPNGIAFDSIDAALRRSTSLEGYPARYAVFTGRIDANKNVGFLLNALEDVVSHDLDLVVIGPDGGKRQEIDVTLGQLDPALRDRVQMLGRVPFPELTRAVRDAEVLLLPSYYEGLPTSVLEAASLGTPAVVAATGGSPELVDQLDAVYGFQVDDRRDFARALAAARASSSSTRARTAQICRGRYDWTVVAQDVEAVYEAVLS